jgi:hypothetical protein
MRLCGQYFNSDVVNRIKAAVESDLSISRSALSRQVCEWLDWRSPNGKLCEMSCRKALLELDKRGVIKLPETDQRIYFAPRSNQEPSEIEGIARVSCGLDELGTIEIIAIPNKNSKLSPIWNNLLDRYHYLGSGPLCGAQIRYLVKSERGWIGALSFSGASWSLKDRDKWVGWSEGARYENLRYVVCNSRFLILPTVKVANLASYTLSQSVKRLAHDWLERYNYKPILLETFVDPDRFTGTCYRAANWNLIGKTSGRRGTIKGGQEMGGAKDIYVYALDSNWQSILCSEPVIGLGDRARPENPVDWAEEEFGSVGFYDNRLYDRLHIIARDFFSQPGVLIPQACNGSQAKMKGAYRFFDNKRVTMDKVIRPHVESTAERIKFHDIVLAVQDTSTLNYTAHPCTEGLGPINTKSDKAVGLILHDTMAFTLEGSPLGLLDVQCWARDEKAAGKSERRKELPIEDKESIKWIKSYRAVSEVQRLCPETMIVSVGDREADIYELFYEASQEAGGAELLVRAERSRNRKVEEEFLWDKMLNEPISGYQQILIPSKGSRPSRIAKLEIRFSEITLKPPQNKELSPVEMWAVYAREIDYPSDLKSPLEWMLLATVPVSNFDDAKERLSWYARRWGIEVYHRTLKSGCRIEDRRFDNADSIESCLAVDMVVAWRIFFLTMQGRETPDISCDIFLKEEEWKVLYARVNNTDKIPPEPPTIQESIRMIASLGGFLGRKSDKQPGTTTLWRGLQRLDDMVSIYRIFNGVQKNGP